MKNFRYLYIVLTMLLTLPAVAQTQPASFVITNAIIHIGNGSVITNGSLLVENGKISSVVQGSLQTAQGIAVIDAKGKHVYPGLIAPGSRLGLEEIEAVRSTLDYEEVGAINPNVRSLISYNTDSRIIPTVRSNGILMAVALPEGGLIPGTSSLMKLAGWNWEDAVYKKDIAVHLNWPRMRISNAWWAPSAEEQRERSAKNLQAIRNFFDEAKAYSEMPGVETKNLRFEAMKDVFNGQKKLIIQANFSKEIIAAVNFAESYGIQAIISGAADAWMLSSFLKEHHVQLILDQPHALPVREDEDVDLPYKRAKILQDSGIVFCMSIEGSWQQRNLPFMAGTLAAYGISKEDALKTVTSNTAKILGIDKTCGTLEAGKDATLLIADGDLLDMRSSNVTHAWINGMVVDLNNKQKELNELYLKKYGLAD